MAEDGRPERPGDEPHRVDEEDVEGGDQGSGLGEEQFGKDEACGGRVQKEVVPLDRRSDRAGDDRSPELFPLVGGGRDYCHVRSPLYEDSPSAKVPQPAWRWAGLHLPSHPLPYLYKDATRRCLLGRGRYENRPELAETGLPVGPPTTAREKATTASIQEPRPLSDRRHHPVLGLLNVPGGIRPHRGPIGGGVVSVIRFLPGLGTGIAQDPDELIFLINRPGADDLEAMAPTKWSN